MTTRGLMLKILVTFKILVYCSACTFPSDLIGSWFSATYGTLEFTDTTITGFQGIQATTLTCNMTSGDRYVIKGSFVLFGVTADMYLCMDLTKVTTDKYVFYLRGDVQAGTSVRFYLSSDPSVSVSMSEACASTTSQSNGEYELIVKTGSFETTSVTSPSAIQSKFDVIVTSSSVTNCNGSTLDGQTPGLLGFNFSSCVTGALNSVTGSTELRSLYTTSSSLTYMTVYNNMTSAQYPFTCWAFSKSGAALYATEYPKACHTNQTSTYVLSPGVSYVMTDLLYSPPEEESNLATILIAVFVTLAVIIIIVIIIIIVYRKFFMKRPAPPPKERKLRTQLSVTDYLSGTPRKGGKTGEDNGQIIKKTAAELITDVDKNKRDSNHSLAMDAYEPPKKEAWQKKWESSPRLEKENKAKYNSNSKLPQDMFGPDKALTMSTSLPESLDNPPGSSPQSSPRHKHRPLNESGRANSENIVSTRAVITPRFHATPKIPESTGKFGSRPVSTEPIVVPMIAQTQKQLDTISENPLSREASTVTHWEDIGSRSQHRSAVARKLVDLPNMMSARSRDRMSSGTASGWRLKWETVMRPAVAKLRQTFARSITPVRLFQNMTLEERSDSKKHEPAPDDVCSIFNVDIRSLHAAEQSSEVEVTQESETTTVVLESETSTHIEYSVKSRSVSSFASTDVLNDRDMAGAATLCVEADDKIRIEADNEMNMNVQTGHLPLDSDGDNISLCFESLNSHMLNMMCEVEKGNNHMPQADVAESVASSNSDKQANPEINFDTISINPDLFFPETWLYSNKFDINTDGIWRECNKTYAIKRRREIRVYLGLHLAPVTNRPARVVKKYKRQRSKLKRQ